jgi:hypothetical protein
MYNNGEVGGSGGTGGETNIKGGNFNSKSTYHGPNWLRIFHVTDEKDTVRATKTQKFPSSWQNIGNESCYIPEHSVKRLQNQ